MKTFQAEILTPERVILAGEVEALVLKGEYGYFGILAGHAPLIARLVPGKLKVKRANKEDVYQAGTGFVQIVKQRVSVLLDEIYSAPVQQ